ncbi:hypothetical protein M422DRAFT_271535 [Sphaerobolus stellatus SS14]|uniref:Uncharacterized protein n=1 Tax=Sphaerobolus stellatus (strain SS14) TaxID=990650 RepID=A0A0C9UPK4_SPHS4|nr:hypothetical protein M422DRAFT_271535 [Sphaerobolus stellatus SS14]
MLSSNASTSFTHVEPFIVSSQATSPCIIPCLFHQPLLTLSPTIPFQHQPLSPHHQRLQTLHVSSTSNHLVDVGPCEAEWVRVVEMIDAPYAYGRTLKLCIAAASSDTVSLVYLPCTSELTQLYFIEPKTELPDIRKQPHVSGRLLAMTAGVHIAILVESFACDANRVEVILRLLLEACYGQALCWYSRYYIRYEDLDL